ncbi:two-component system vancomycin resistance sensor histidine kinase VraS [Ureibacillus xyleni]|uniref:Sensor histidine kinase n=1 Tax=Ureibacillus xyleni TaxID=614648 RepID=A0A285RP19_9BACL|nr:sensor histidine kinase [Ureibacillus xyleni]SOB94057.1 two-component system vancomycin resistance sensor histidine kinase VraS [Ureibacillus xyleni]
MISFIFRTITLFFLLSGMTFFFCYLFFGEPNEENWEILWQQNIEDIPFIAIIFTFISLVSVSISIWMSIVAKTRETAATRYVKQVVEPDFSLKKKNVSHALKKALLQANELIDTQRKSLQRLTNEKAEANDKVIQERIIAERQRLARELHDSVSQQLFAASMLLSAVTEQEDELGASKHILQQVEKIVQQAQLEMRALLLHLRPIALRNNTLAQGLTELIVELQQKVYFNIDYKIEEIVLSKAEEDHLFRIAQEALSNTLRHSKATEVELLLIARDNFGILRIQDNGQGFNMEEDKSTSYGLKNIAERAVEIGCTYKIVSVPDVGTIVEVKVPLKTGTEIEEHVNAAEIE